MTNDMTNNPLAGMTSISKLLHRLSKAETGAEAAELLNEGLDALVRVVEVFDATAEEDARAMASRFPHLNKAEEVTAAAEELEQAQMGALLDAMEKLVDAVGASRGIIPTVKLAPLQSLLTVWLSAQKEGNMIVQAQAQVIPFAIVDQLVERVQQESADPETGKRRPQATMHGLACHCVNCIITQLMLEALTAEAGTHGEGSIEMAAMRAINASWAEQNKRTKRATN